MHYTSALKVFNYSQGYSTVGSEARPLGSRGPEFLHFSGLFDSNLFLAARGLGTLGGAFS